MIHTFIFEQLRASGAESPLEENEKREEREFPLHLQIVA
jgi:hypothetical protein